LRRWYARDLLDSLGPKRRSSPIRFLDVGAGTGQFASALHAEAAAQGLDLHITLLEPSPAFRHCLEQSQVAESADLIDKRLEEFVPSDTFDLVLVSEVAHLFESHEVAFDKLRDMVSVGGIVALRYGSRAQVRSRNWYEFVPAAAEVDLARAPARGEYEELLAERGFAWTAADVDESRELSGTERLGIVAAKAYSSYCLVEPVAFKLGLRRLTDALEKRAMSTCWESWMTWTKTWLPEPR
jgi:SAM-dependent methyltransferase